MWKLVFALFGLILLRTSSVEAGEKFKGVINTPMSFAHLNKSDGLPRDNVYDIVQDQIGFLWFATEGGLAKYDGSRFTVYTSDSDESSSISADVVTRLRVDGKGRIWIGTVDGGLNYYDPVLDKFTHYTHEPDNAASICSDGILDIAVGPGDEIWVAAAGCVGRLIPETGEFVRFDILDQVGDSVMALLVEEETIWVGTSGRGLFKFDPKSEKLSTVTGLNSKSVSIIVRMKNGDLWVGTNDAGINVMKHGTEKIDVFVSSKKAGSLSDNRIRDVLENSRGEIWVGTEDGLSKFRPKTHDFDVYEAEPSNPNSLSHSWVLSLFEDRAGVMWVGCNGLALNRFDSLRSTFATQYIGGATSSSFYEKGDVVWVGVRGGRGGLVKYDYGKMESTTYASIDTADGGEISLEGLWVTSLFQDKNDTLWISTMESGLFAFDLKAETIRQYTKVDEDSDEAGLLSDAVFKILPADDDRLWLGMWQGGGVALFDKRTGEADVYRDEDWEVAPLSSRSIYTIFKDRFDPDLLWIGTAGGGLNVLNAEQQISEAFQPEPDIENSLSHSDVTCIYQNDDGLLWIGTYGGGINLFNYKDKSFKKLSKKDGLPSNNVWGIMPDSQGRLWISTDDGLAMLDQQTFSFTRYGVADGLQGDQFVQGAYLAGESGRLYLGGTQGFNSFVPTDVAEDKYPPPVVATKLTINDQEYTPISPMWTSPRLHLGYKDDVVRFEFAALSFIAPGKNRFAYRLAGSEYDKWVETSFPFATYTDLDGGDYTFEVKAANRHGLWNDEVLKIPLLVDSPPWLRWWAFLIYGFGFVGILFIVYRYQGARISRLAQENRLAEVEHGLALAGAVQAGFLPREPLHQSERLTVLGFYRPADKAGGDWWWHEQVLGGTHSILIGDVTGHGAGPAMVTAAAATCFRARHDVVTMTDALHLMNREVQRVGDNHYMMTMSALEIDLASGAYVLYSAAGLPVLSAMPDRDIAKVIPCRGTPLGSQEFELGRREGKMSPGERLLIFTDGIPEIEMKSGKQIGMRRFAKMWNDTINLTIEQAAKQIVSQADNIRGETLQDDDWTFAIVEWHGPGNVQIEPVASTVPRKLGGSILS